MKRLILKMFIAGTFLGVLISSAFSYPDFCFNVEPGCAIGCHNDDYLALCNVSLDGGSK
jgi:hypothetical protein